MNKLTILSNDDDWEALYVNSKLAFQSHHVRIYDLKEFTPIESIVKLATPGDIYDLLADWGQFPTDLSLEEVLCAENWRELGS